MRIIDATATAFVVACASAATSCGGSRPPPPSQPAEAVIAASAPSAPVVPAPPKHSFHDEALAADVDWAKGIAAEDDAFARLDRGDAEGALAAFEQACALRAECNQSRAGAALALRALGEEREARALLEQVRTDAEHRAGETARVENSTPPVGVTAGSPIGSRWAIVSRGELVILRASSLREVARIHLPKHEGPVPGRTEDRTCVEQCAASAFSRDGRWFAWTGVADSLDLVDMTNGQAASVAHDTGWDPMDVQLSADGTVLASNVKDGIALFEITSRARQRVVPGKAPIALSADGARITTSAGVFDVATGKKTADAPQPKMLPQKTPAFRRVPSPDGKRLAAAAILDYVELLDLATMQKMRTWKTHLAFEGVAFSPDGATLAAWGKPARIMLLDASGQTGDRELDATELGRREIIDDVTFSPDGKLLVAQAHTPALAAWDLPSGARAALRKHGDERQSCAVGRDRFPVEVCRP